MPDSLPPLTMGECDCGGTFRLDPESVDRHFVSFPCDAEDCDWVSRMPRAELEHQLADEDFGVDDYADGGRQEVPA